MKQAPIHIEEEIRGIFAYRVNDASHHAVLITFKMINIVMTVGASYLLFFFVPHGKLCFGGFFDSLQCAAKQIFHVSFIFESQHMWLLLLTSCELKWYFDHNQLTATIISFTLGLAEGYNKDFLDSVKDVPVLSIHHFLSAWLNLINASLSTMSHYFPYAIAIILFVSCTIVSGIIK